MKDRVKVGVSYFGVRNPLHVAHDLYDMASNGIDFVVHTYTENDMIFYHDTMVEIVQLSHKMGLEVYIDPWGVLGIFGGEAFSRFVARNRDANQVFSNGETAPAACPNNPKTVDYMMEWLEKAADTGADVVFFDEPHFSARSDRWACRCEHCQRKFREIYGHDMPLELTDEVMEFRFQSIAEFLKKLAAKAKELGMRTAVCMLPREHEATHWETIFSMPEIDIVGTDPYWVPRKLTGDDVYRHVRKFSDMVMDLATKYGKEPQIWIQLFGIPSGQEGDIEIAVRAARDAGVANLVAWSYRATAYMSYIRSDDPEMAWATLLKAYRNAKKTHTIET